MSSRARPTEAGDGFEDFRAALRRDWPSGYSLDIRRRVDSTNALARRALDAGGSEGLRTFVAWSQTAGRGRRGRGWLSPPGGGLYSSVLVPLPRAAMLELLPLLLPVSVCEALREIGVDDCSIKWPNDLMTGGAKLGGLLLEAVAAGSAPRAVILGVGVNRDRPRGDELATPPIGLVERLDPAPTLAELVGRILVPLLERLSRLDTLTAGDVIAPYRRLSAHAPGERVVCRTAADTVVGAFRGFDDRGFLRLDVEGGERRIGSGELVQELA